MSGEHPKIALKGAVTGFFMCFPGMSGGSIAFMLGEYRKLLSAVNGIFSSFSASVLYLLSFLSGGIAGLVLYGFTVSRLASAYPHEFSYIVAAASVIIIPFTFRHSSINAKKVSTYIFIVAGAAIGAASAFIPRGLTNASDSLPLVFAFSIPLAAALVLPGISFSYMLYAVGLYDRFFNAIRVPDIPFLLIFTIGMALGILIFSRILTKLYERFPSQTDSAVLGFIVSSLIVLFLF